MAKKLKLTLIGTSIFSAIAVPIVVSSGLQQTIKKENNISNKVTSDSKTNYPDELSKDLATLSSFDFVNKNATIWSNVVRETNQYVTIKLSINTMGYNYLHPRALVFIEMVEYSSNTNNYEDTGKIVATFTPYTAPNEIDYETSVEFNVPKTSKSKDIKFRVAVREAFETEVKRTNVYTWYSHKIDAYRIVDSEFNIRTQYKDYGVGEFNLINFKENDEVSWTFDVWENNEWKRLNHNYTIITKDILNNGSRITFNINRERDDKTYRVAIWSAKDKHGDRLLEGSLMKTYTLKGHGIQEEQDQSNDKIFVPFDIVNYNEKYKVLNEDSLKSYAISQNAKLNPSKLKNDYFFSKEVWAAFVGQKTFDNGSRVDGFEAYANIDIEVSDVAGQTKWEMTLKTTQSYVLRHKIGNKQATEVKKIIYF